MGGMTLFIGSDLYVDYFGASDSYSGAFLNTGTCSFALYSGAGTSTPVAGGTGACPYLAGSNGNYQGVLAAALTATLTAGALYTLVIKFTQAAYTDTRTLIGRAVARERT